MNKEEILQKSRAEKKDEGEIHALRTGHSWGFFGTTVMYLLVTMATILCDGRVYTLAPFHAIYYTSLGMHMLGYAKASTKKVFVVFGVIAVLSGIGFLILYVTDLLA